MLASLRQWHSALRRHGLQVIGNKGFFAKFLAAPSPWIRWA